MNCKVNYDLKSFMYFKLLDALAWKKIDIHGLFQSIVWIDFAIPWGINLHYLCFGSKYVFSCCNWTHFSFTCKRNWIWLLCLIVGIVLCILFLCVNVFVHKHKFSSWFILIPKNSRKYNIKIAVNISKNSRKIN